MLSRRRHRGRLVVLGGICTCGWLAAVFVGHGIDFGPELSGYGRVFHVLALVVSFGAVLVTDWFGLLWLFGKRDMHEFRRLEAAVKPLIWGGLALLLVSGSLLHPDLGKPATVVKLGCVLLIMLNGLGVGPAINQLSALPASTRFGDLGKALQIRLIVVLGISQTCWLTSALIGIFTSTARRVGGL